MKLRAAIIVLCLAFGALSVAPPSAPASVAYVHSNSMAPTIEEGDGYFLGPAGTVGEGDVVTFYSERHDEYVTHRVVGTTDDGFLTKGDNNRVVDQSNGYPHVDREDVAGRVVTVGGTPITIPGFGTAVEAMAAHRGPLLALLAGLLGLAVILTTGPTLPTRPVYHVGTVFHALLAVAFLVTVVLVLVGGSGVEVTLVERGVAAGDEEVQLDADGTATVDFVTHDAPLTVRAGSATGATIEDRQYADGTTSVTVRPHGEPTDGRYAAALRFNAYPAVLPGWLIEWLHGVSPALASSVTVGICYLPVYVAYRFLFDGGVPIRGPRIRTPRRGVNR